MAGVERRGPRRRRPRHDECRHGPGPVPARSDEGLHQDPGLGQSAVIYTMGGARPDAVRSLDLSMARKIS